MYAKSDDLEPHLAFGNPFGEPIDLNEYWEETKKPFCNLVFVLPLIMIYEVCVAATGRRNGADYLMGLISSHVSPILPSFVILLTFVFWQMVIRSPISIKLRTFWLMSGECILYAIILILSSQTITLALQNHGNWAMYIGAGIYEEFLFRVCLIPAFYGVFTFLCFPRNWAIVLSAITTSILFSLAHYDQITVATFFQFNFIFRTLAGLFFAAVYLKRGYGIAAGSHAFYDIVISTF